MISVGVQYCDAITFSVFINDLVHKKKKFLVREFGNPKKGVPLKSFFWFVRDDSKNN